MWMSPNDVWITALCATGFSVVLAASVSSRVGRSLNTSRWESPDCAQARAMMPTDRIGECSDARQKRGEMLPHRLVLDD